MRFARWLICIATLATFSTAHATETLTSFDNTYTAKLYGFSIEATSRFKMVDADKGVYQFSFAADAMLGNIKETTTVTWNAQEQIFIPHRYTYKRSGLGKGRNDEVVFDWVQHKATNINTNKIIPIEANTKLQDSISYQLQLRQDLIAGKNKLEYTITNGRKIKKYQFEVIGEETLNTPLGDVKTIKVKRSNSNEDKATYAWFAKNHSYLLVRLQQEENGSAYTIYLSKASLNGKAIEHF